VPQQLSSSSSSGRPTPRLLAATETVPIRIWVEYQGIDSLSADGKQHLQNVVKISLGVLQKFYKVGNCCKHDVGSSAAEWHQGAHAVSNRRICVGFGSYIICLAS
jgi:hypothetical protein